MLKIVLVGTGGALGAISRYAVAVGTQGWTAHTAFPWGTFLVNLIGCLLIGILSNLEIAHNVLTEELRLLFLVGFVGAFTTFSTFTFDYWALAESGEFVRSGLYVLASLCGGFFAFTLGLYLSRA